MIVNCTFIRSEGRISCERCGYSMSWTRDVLPKRNCQEPPPPAPAFGPGTELAALVKQIGGADQHGCGCDAMIEKMNRWGVDGCREHRAEIIAQLTASAAKWGIADWVKGGLLAIYRGTAMLLDPRDPIGSLVDLAIATSRRKSSNDDAPQ